MVCFLSTGTAEQIFNRELYAGGKQSLLSEDEGRLLQIPG